MWRLSALVDGRLSIKTKYLPPGPSRYSSGPIQTLVFSVQTLELGIGRADQQTTAQIQRQLGITPTQKPKARAVEFHAVLPDTKPVFLNAGTETKVAHDFLGSVGSTSTSDTFLDATRDLEFALVQREDDLHVHARSKSRYHGKNPADDHRLFQGLLRAVGFTHGVHPWPCRLEYRRNGRKILDRVRICEARAHSRYVPFTLGWGMGIKEQDPRHGVGASVRLAAEFLAQDDPLAEAIADFLYYYREASDERAEFGLATHALCTILEGLVREVVAARKLATATNAPGLADFEKAKIAAAQLLKAQLSGVDSAIVQRLAGSMRSLAAFDIREQFKLVSAHLGLPWVGLMADLFQAWKTHRNLTHHGGLRGRRDEEFRNQATIAAAINLIILRLAGYHGTAFRSLWGYKRQDSVCHI